MPRDRERKEKAWPHRGKNQTPNKNYSSLSLYAHFSAVAQRLELSLFICYYHNNISSMFLSVARWCDCVWMCLSFRNFYRFLSSITLNAFFHTISMRFDNLFLVVGFDVKRRIYSIFAMCLPFLS